MYGQSRIFWCLFWVPSLFAAVVPDGTTATIVQHTVSKPVIQPAPANVYGVSFNRYQQFDIDDVGLDFDNRTVQANTLINEVTSLMPTQLAGRLQVLGPSAHVMIANPNGIQVNGVECVNTKGIVLTTAKINQEPTFITRTIPFTTEAGHIAIEGDGWVGAFEALAIIAKTIDVHAPIEERSFLPNATVRLLAGESVSSLSGDALSAEKGQPWLNTDPMLASEALVSQEKASISLDISSLGHIRAGSITLLVTSMGAGVAHAGHLNATAGDIHIISNGAVTVNAGRLKSAKAIKVNAKQNIVNLNGQWQASGALVVQTPADFIQTWAGDFHDVEVTPFFEKKGHAWLHGVTRKGFTVSYGHSEGNAPELRAHDLLSITAKAIINQGASFISEGDMQLKGEAIHLVSFQEGTFYYEQTCGWFCHDRVIDHVKQKQAQILVGGGLHIDAAQQFENKAALAWSAQDFHLTSSQIILSALPILSRIQYKSYFSAHHAHYSSFKTEASGGLLFSSSGALFLQSEHPILNQASGFWGEAGQSILSPIITQETPALNLPYFSHHFGFMPI